MSLAGNEWGPADVAAVTGNGNGYGNDGFGGGAWWLLVLFLFAFAGNGWGNGWGANSGGGGATYIGVDGAVQRGFDQSAVMGGINGLNAGLNGIQQALCSGFAGVNNSVANGFAQAEISANARQMADMNQAFALQSQLAQCCCDNRLATANLASVIQTENCADRQAISDGIRDLLVAQNNGTQKILDQLCADKMDAKNERIADLERQLTMANFAASQDARTSQILADNARQTATLEDYLNPVPRPAYMVQNPNCCQQNVGCGCGNF